MSSYSRSRSLQNLRQVSRNHQDLPVPAAIAAEAGRQGQSPDGLPPKSRGVLKLKQWWEQLGKEKEVDTAVHDHRSGNREELEKLRDDNATQLAKYQAEMSRVVLEDGVEKRALQTIRSAMLRTGMKTTDAIQVLSFYTDRTLHVFDEMIRCDEVRDRAKAAAIFVLERQLADLRLSAIGQNDDPTVGDGI